MRNTHDAYRLFYTILLSIGLSLGFGSITDLLNSITLSRVGEELPVMLTFGVFLFVVLRFFLGGVRHLEETYM